jgi:hypothetical protein
MIVDSLKELKEFISGEFQKNLLVRDETDPIWTIQSDVMADFASYFPIDNPKNVASKVNSMKKRKLCRLK